MQESLDDIESVFEEVCAQFPTHGQVADFVNRISLSDLDLSPKRLHTLLLNTKKGRDFSTCHKMMKYVITTFTKRFFIMAMFHTFEMDQDGVVYETQLFDSQVKMLEKIFKAVTGQSFIISRDLNLFNFLNFFDIDIGHLESRWVRGLTFEDLLKLDHVELGDNTDFDYEERTAFLAAVEEYYERGTYQLSN